VKSVSSVVPANRFDAIGWEGRGIVVVSAAVERDVA
jgi:hypothetical protein